MVQSLFRFKKPRPSHKATTCDNHYSASSSMSIVGRFQSQGILLFNSITTAARGRKSSIQTETEDESQKREEGELVRIAPSTLLSDETRRMLLLTKDDDGNSNTSTSDVCRSPPSSSKVKNGEDEDAFYTPQHQHKTQPIATESESAMQGRAKTPFDAVRDDDDNDKNDTTDLEAGNHDRHIKQINPKDRHSISKAYVTTSAGVKVKQKSNEMAQQKQQLRLDAHKILMKPLEDSLMVHGKSDSNNFRITAARNRNAKRRRLSVAKRRRLTMREINSNIQPGRHFNTIDSSMPNLEKRKTITLPKIIDFFRRVEIKLIAINVITSVVLTVFVLYVCPSSWQEGLADSTLAVSILGAFLSFALVFRTQSCYARWWEARSMWGKMTSSCVNIAGMARAWFGDEELVDTLLTHCIVFAYASKAVLRGHQLIDAAEEGPRLLYSLMLTDAEIGTITRHGKPPFVCLEIMRRIVHLALQEENNCKVSSVMLSGLLLSFEQNIYDLNLCFGACMKINSTRMPGTYTIFMRSFVILFFVLASVTWAPTLKWLTPIITGLMVFLINTVIIIGDQMIVPFDGDNWAGLPLQKYCVIIEHEVMNVSRRHADIQLLV